EAIEQIDIGGPSMLRSAAKNHERVWVVTDPADYAPVLEGLEHEGEAALALRRSLAVKVFHTTSAYDAAIAAYLNGGEGGQKADTEGVDEALPAELSLRLERVQTLRYGENPDQPAAFYRGEGARGGL